MATVDGRVLSEPSSSRLGRSWGVMMTMSAPHRPSKQLRSGTRQTGGGARLDILHVFFLQSIAQGMSGGLPGAQVGLL
jgi:hypothetical protein